MNRFHVRVVDQSTTTRSTQPTGRGSAYGLTDVISYISQLDLQGIEDIQSRAQNKQEDSVLSDEELALALFAEEASGLLNVVRDRYGQDVSQSHSIMDELEEMEEAARYDHLVALAIHEDRPIPPRPQRANRNRPPTPPQACFAEEEEEVSSEASSLSSDAESETEEHVVDRLLALKYLQSSSNFRVAASGSSTTHQESQGPSRTTQSEPACAELDAIGPPMRCSETVCCTICGDDADTDDCYMAPCGHWFDMSCLDDMFRRATCDESLYPPSCCQQSIPVVDVREHLGSQLMADFAKKAKEFETRDRVYCYKPKCSAFLGAATPDNAIPMRCSECYARTCGFCKSEAHPGVKCSDGAALNGLAKEMHDKEGWQRCPSCRHLVEKSEGCYHIVCICQAQFCYLCAVPWKGCSCPQFEVPPET